MIVVLGKSCRPLPHRDGQCTAGVSHCSADGFAATLALHAGAPCLPSEDAAVELAATLEKSLRDEDFFAASFRVDPLGVARKLLELIEEISFAAPADFTWTSLQSGQDRVACLARLALESEKAGRATVSSMLRRVIAAVRTSELRLPFEELRLVDERASWPRLWQELFDALAAGGCAITRHAYAQPADADTDLSHAARKLSLDRGLARVDFRDDGSLVRLHGATAIEAADAAAALLSEAVAQGQSVLLVRSGETRLLEDALQRQDLAALGCVEDEQASGPSVVLPLVVSLLGGHVEASHYLAFLHVEPSPLPPGLRRMLLESLQERQTVDAGVACALADTYAAKIQHDAVADKLARWKSWLGLLDCASPGAVSRQELERALELVEAWARSSAADPGKASEARVFRDLADRTQRLRVAVDTLAATPLTKSSLQSLLTQIPAHATTSTRRERSRVVAVDDPAMILHPVDTVIWWMAHDTALAKPRWPFWTDAEQETLRRAGVDPTDPERVAFESYAAAVRLVTQASRRLVLVTAERVGDDPAEVHPLWYELKDAFDEKRPPPSRSIPETWEWLKAQGRQDILPSKAATPVRFETIWTIPDAPYAPRKEESPSSLEKLLGCPLAWTLQYRARLNDASSYALADGFLLLGILAHACFEDFFKDGSWLLPMPAARERAKEIFERMLRARAATLLGKGRERECLEVRDKTVEGMLDLASQLQKGGWELVSAEEALAAGDLEQPVGGRPDLVFRRRERPSEKLVVDVKYVGKARRTAELARGTAVQLATYGRILKAGEAWPRTAYYIVATQDLLTVHDDVAPGAVRIDGEAEPDVWSRVDRAIAGVKSKLAEGLVEVGLESDRPQELAEAGRLIAAPCRYCDYGVICRANRRSA